MGLFSALKEKATQYVDVYVKLIKLNFIGRTSSLLSYFMFALISMFIAFCIILFLGFGLAEVLADAGLSRAAAFFITIGVYVLMLIIVMAGRKKITRFFAGSIIKLMTEAEEEEIEKEKDV